MSTFNNAKSRCREILFKKKNVKIYFSFVKNIIIINVC